MSPARQGALIALVTLLLDQISKLWVLFGYQIELHGDLRLAPFATITLVWNRGISYGLFQQEAEWGRWALVIISFIAAIAFSVWLAKNPPRLVAWALGLVIGGAIGNGIDRAAYGAVVDFVHLHWGGFSWYVFNVADCAIVVGVALLLLDALRPSAEGESDAANRP
ncbi:MAG: signal peptidase II [Beijerinckiaceae bacterium]|nr:signal peptidase II [Beijerinckiaceae bacterium]